VSVVRLALFRVCRQPPPSGIRPNLGVGLTRLPLPPALITAGLIDLDDLEFRSPRLPCDFCAVAASAFDSDAQSVAVGADELDNLAGSTGDRWELLVPAFHDGSSPGFS
jgi:hypothetical protein